ncbi:MAG TPA: hypothetical protein VN408_37065 [Actinoplanes sp.]|nr:hypothetical protein [Actinoplanes sp.]
MTARVRPATELQILGCSVAQGRLFAKPMPVQEFAAFTSGTENGRGSP